MWEERKLKISKTTIHTIASLQYNQINPSPSKKNGTKDDPFVNKTKVEINQLLEANFIYEIEHTKWVSPIMVVTKKNRKM